MFAIFTRFSIRVQLFLAFTALFTVTFVATTVVFYNRMTSVAMTNLRNDLNGSATTLAAHLDAKTVLAVHTARVYNSPLYKQLQAQLIYTKTSDPKIRAAYIMMLNGTTTSLDWVVTARLQPSCKCNVTRLKYQLNHQPEMLRAFNGPTSSPGIYSDIYGSWFSGYAPIKDAAGKSVAIVGVDMTAQSVLQVQDEIKHTSVVVFIASLFVLLILIPLLSQMITSRLRTVTEAARAIELGKPPHREALDRVAVGRDEVSVLARSFAKMAVEVENREQNLKRQVQELKIEIDQSKQNKQVEEITDTDFFRDLQSKAHRLRAATAEANPA